MSWNYKLPLISISHQFQRQRTTLLYLVLVLLSVLTTLAIIGITDCFDLPEERTMVLSLASVLIAILSSAIFAITNSIQLPNVSRAIALDNLKWTVDYTDIQVEMPIYLHYQTASLIEVLTKFDAVNQQLEKRIVDLNRELHFAKAENEIANQVKSNFLSEMSDELRTPLNAILGTTQIMQQEPETTRSQQADLKVIHRNSQHLVTAIDKMLMRSRLEVGQTCLEPSVCNATNSESEAIQAGLAVEPTALKIMPQEWLIQLERAASELDKEAISSLLGSIPDKHTSLAEALQNKIDNFDFDEITDLVKLVRR